MAVDKKFVDKLAQNLNSFSESKTEDLIYVLNNLNNELQTAKEVVSLMEKNHLKDLNITFEDFYENTLPTVISKTIYDFFRDQKENVSNNPENISSEIKAILLSQIGSSYKRHILISLDSIPKIFNESNYVTEKLSSVEVINCINKVRNDISNQAFDLIEKNPPNSEGNIPHIHDLSELTKQIKNLSTKLADVLESSALLSKTASDTSKNILKHHYDNNSFNTRLSSTSSMFADMTVSLLKQRQGPKDLANFYNYFSSFQKNKKLFSIANNGDLSSISVECRDFLKLIMSFKTKLPQNEYKKLFEAVGISVNTFLKEIESSRTSSSNFEFSNNSGNIKEGNLVKHFR